MLFAPVTANSKLFKSSHENEASKKVLEHITALEGYGVQEFVISS